MNTGVNGEGGGEFGEAQERDGEAQERDGEEPRGEQDESDHDSEDWLEPLLTAAERAAPARPRVQGRTSAQFRRVIECRHCGKETHDDRFCGRCGPLPDPRPGDVRSLISSPLHTHGHHYTSVAETQIIDGFVASRASLPRRALLTRTSPSARGRSSRTWLATRTQPGQ